MSGSPAPPPVRQPADAPAATATRRSVRGIVAAVLSPEPYRGPVAPVWAQVAMVLVASIIFGFQFVTFKEAFESVGPSTLLALRALFMLPVLLVLMRWAGIPLRAPRASVIPMLLPATLLVGSLICFMFGVHRLSAGLTATLVSMTPIFSIGLGLLFGMERVGVLALLGSVVGTVGVAIATGALHGDLDALGLALIAGSNTTYSLSFITLKRMRANVSSAVYLLLMTVISILLFVPLAIALDGFAITPTWGLAGSVAYVVVLGQAVAYIASLGLLRFAGVFQATLVTPLIPVFAIFFAVLLLGEPLLGRELGGGALIILGVIAAIVPASRLRAR